MRERNNAVAKYIAAEKECRNSSNIFATLNAIRCEFAIRNGHDSYIAQCNEGGKKNVPINWKSLQVKGLRRRVSAATGYKQNRLSAPIAYTRRWLEKYWNSSCAAGAWVKVKQMRENEKRCISAATILVVEDETLILMMIADHLRDAGLTVIEARHAGEALAILSTPAAIDLVITDVRMPGGLDGLALAKCVKQQKTTIPVIVVSGDLSHAPSQEIANAFFPKPYDLNVVLTRVRELLNVTRRDASPPVVFVDLSGVKPLSLREGRRLVQLPDGLDQGIEIGRANRVRASDDDLTADLDLDHEADALRSCSNSFGYRRISRLIDLPE